VALIVVAGAAALVTPILLGRSVDRAQSSIRSGASENDTSIFEQFIALDEVVITSTAGEVDVPANGATIPRFDRSAALAAIRAAGVRAADCGPEALGSVDVSVTFAPTGETLGAELLSGSMLDTPTGSCIVHQLRNVRVPPFAGETETVRTALTPGD